MNNLLNVKTLNCTFNIDAKMQDVTSHVNK